MIIITADVADVQELQDKDEVNAMLGPLELFYPGTLKRVETMRAEMGRMDPHDRIAFTWDAGKLTIEHMVPALEGLGWQVAQTWTGKELQG